MEARISTLEPLTTPREHGHPAEEYEHHARTVSNEQALASAGSGGAKLMAGSYDYGKKRTVLGQRRFDRWKFAVLVLLGSAIALIVVVIALLK
jgi:hypothetical protein